MVKGWILGLGYQMKHQAKYSGGFHCSRPSFMNFIAHSHLVIATKDVALITDYWSQLLEIEPHFQNKGFSEFVLPSGFRFAFFLPTGKSGQHFSNESDRSQCSFWPYRKGRT